MDQICDLAPATTFAKWQARPEATLPTIPAMPPPSTHSSTHSSLSASASASKPVISRDAALDRNVESTPMPTPTWTVPSCPICLVAFAPGSLLRPLPCQHAFHAFCVEKWLTTREHRCPACRTPVSTCESEGEAGLQDAP